MPEIRTPFWKTLTRGAILLGLLSLLAGLALRNILDRLPVHNATIKGPIIAGAVLFLGGVLLNVRWLAGMIFRRRFLAGLNAWFMALLATLVLIAASAVVVMTPQTEAWFLDVTGSRLHTLSPQTLNILKSLDQPIEITMVTGSGVVDLKLMGKVDIASRLKDLLLLYRAHGVKVEIVDAYADKARAEMLGLRLGAAVPPDTLVVAAGERNMQIPYLGLLEVPSVEGMLSGGESLGFRGEEKITSAILALTEREPTRVYFLTGHGEAPLAGDDAADLRLFAAELRRDNFTSAPLNLLQRDEIPEDAGIIVIAGPTVALQIRETELLSAFLKQGGRMFLLARPSAAGGSLAGLETLLAEHNVRVRDGEAIIEVYRAAGSSQAAGDVRVVVSNYGVHPITDDVRTINCLLQLACPVGAGAPEPAPGEVQPRLLPPFTVVELMRSGPESWGETNLTARQVRFDAGQDRQGPLPMAVAVEPRAPAQGMAPAPDTRLVVIGSPSLITGDSLKSYEGNRTFAMNCMNWLARKEARLGIPPQRPERRALTAGPAGLRAMFFLTVLAMPLLAILAGGMVWWMRRR